MRVSTTRFHLCALTATVVQNTDQDLTPVPDGIAAIQNAHFFFENDMQLLFAMYMQAAGTRARILTPATRQITPPHIVPIELVITPGARPAVADYSQYPMQLKRLEEIQVNVFQTAADANGSVLLALAEQPLPPIPAGPMFTMRGTSTTAAVANTWTLLAVTWNDVLPEGEYAVGGLVAISATGKASRLIMEQGFWRPGAPSVSVASGYTHPLMRMGKLGDWGHFTGNRMPQIEVLCNTTDNAHTIYLDFVRVR